MSRKKSRPPPVPPPPPPPAWTAPILARRHQRTVAAIYETPTRANVPWNAFVALVTALGGTIANGNGSRRQIDVGTRRANLHEPHPSPDMKKGAVEDVRAFLKLLGVRP